MQGTVKFLNEEDALAGVETEQGGFAIIGLMDDGQVALGDTLSGELDGDGGATLTNETQGTQFEVYIEATGVSAEFAQDQVG